MKLNVSNITFGYEKGKSILNELSFNVSHREILGILGGSGFGKSTLLKILSGIIVPSKDNFFSGKIRINGQEPDLYRRTGKLSFMFQEAALMPNLSVKENISLPLSIKGFKDDKRVIDLMQNVGLIEYSAYLPKQLSGGMKTRVSLARSFVTEPELLLLDEPFSDLDIAWKSDLYKSLIRLTEEFNTTVIMVTHDVQEALILSNRILIVNRFGTIQAQHKINSITPVSERVNNINDFLKENYEELFIPIQKSIMTDGGRANIPVDEVLQTIESIIEISGSEYEENLVSKDRLNSIRDFSNEEEVNEKLLIAFNKAKTDDLKYKLLWDILEYEKLPERIHKDLFNYYFKNIKIFSEYSRQWYNLHNNDRFFEILKGRIESSKGFNYKKKWIYLCDLYAVSDLPQVNQIFDNVIAGNVEQLNYPFAKYVARKIRDKIKNEKMGTLRNS